MPKQYSIEEMQAQITQLQATIALPGVPDDEKQIYHDTIARIQAEINTRQAQPAPLPAEARRAKEGEQIKHTTPPPPPPPSPLSFRRGAGGEVDASGQSPLQEAQGVENQQPPLKPSNPQTLKPSQIHAGNQHPVNSATPLTATLEVEKDTDPYNPRIRIHWADGYTITVTETEARGRFTSTLRDTCALKLVQQGRYHAMWRWSSPWRAAGLYQALTHLRGGTPPTLRDLDINRPTDIQKETFQHITEKALTTT